MVIAGPQEISDADLATWVAANAANVIPDSYYAGDCTIDTLSGNKSYQPHMNNSVSSVCAREDVTTRHLRLQHGAAHVRPRLGLLCDHHTGHRHRDIRHQELANQGDAVRVWQPQRP